MKNAIILCSGGIDSTTTAHLSKTLNYGSLIILFFNYNQRNLKAEKKYSKLSSKNIKAKFIELKLPELAKISTSQLNNTKKPKVISRKNLKNTRKESQKWYVPFRNTIFITYALALAETLHIKSKKTYDILTGFKNEGKEDFPDTTQDYLNKFNNLVKTSTSINIKIKAPLIRKDKEDIILLAKKLNINLKQTHSCYSSNKHCGICLACQLRKEGFYWANVKDSTNYSN